MECWICGKEATKRRNIGTREYLFLGIQPFENHNQRRYCDVCFEKTVRELESDKKEYVRLKKKMMFERAVDILEHQKLNIYDYKEAIEAVKEYSEEKPDKFDSAYEMIAAIMNTRAGSIACILPAYCFTTLSTNTSAPRLSVIAFKVQAKVRIRIAGTIALKPSGKHSIHSFKLITLLTI